MVGCSQQGLSKAIGFGRGVLSVRCVECKMLLNLRMYQGGCLKFQYCSQLFLSITQSVNHGTSLSPIKTNILTRMIVTDKAYDVTSSI